MGEFNTISHSFHAEFSQTTAAAIINVILFLHRHFYLHTISHIAMVKAFT